MLITKHHKDNPLFVHHFKFNDQILRMRTLSLILSVLLIAAAFLAFRPAPQNSEITWTDLETAMKRAQEEKKPIFVDVYADWCGWCKRMDKVTFENEDVAAYVNENYIAVKLDAESNKQVSFKGETYTYRQLVKQTFGVRGLPTIMLISPDGETIQARSGFKKPNAFTRMLKQFKQVN